MQNGFIESFFNVSHNVLGYKLKPLCAAHLFALEAAGNPVLFGKKYSSVDLLYCVKVCASEIKLRNGLYLPYTDHKITLFDHYRLSKLNINKVYFLRQSKRLTTYVEDALTIPEKMHLTGHIPSSVTCPNALATATAGIRYFGEERAWTMPFGALVCYLEVLAELQGAKIKFAPDEETKQRYAELDRQADEAGARILEAIKNGKN